MMIKFLLVSDKTFTC